MTVKPSRSATTNSVLPSMCGSTSSMRSICGKTILEPFCDFDFLHDVDVDEIALRIGTDRVHPVWMIEQEHFARFIAHDLHVGLVWYFVQLHMSLDTTIPHFEHVRVW